MDGRKVHLHANHGVIIATETIAEAFDYLYYLERAAEVTVKAMSTGKPLKLIDEAVLKDTCAKFKGSGVAKEVCLGQFLWDVNDRMIVEIGFCP